MDPSQFDKFAIGDKGGMVQVYVEEILLQLGNVYNKGMTIREIFRISGSDIKFDLRVRLKENNFLRADNGWNECF